jgi:hypothetical protein
MLKHLLAAAMAAALIAAPAAPAFAQAASEKSGEAAAKKPKKPRKAKAKKELSAQQLKMKDCAAKWGDHKKEKKVKGRAEYSKFMSGCLKA